MIAQMRSREPLTENILYSIGVTKPGHRARLLAHLEDASVTDLTTRRKAKHNKTPSVYDPNIPSRNQLEDWLVGMNISELLPNFIDSGYDDLDEICYLMGTSYPLTDKILDEELGVNKPGFRTRILLNLQNVVQAQETQRDKIPPVEFEKEEKKFACEMCKIM